MAHLQDITRETAAALALMQSIRDVVDGDEQAVADAIEGETNLHDAIAAAVDRIAAIQTMTDVLKAREGGMKVRRQRLDEQAQKIKRAIVTAMEALEQRKIELPTATIYTSTGRRSAVITDETKLPEWALIPQPPKPDKDKITKALIDGQTIEGAVLSNTSTTLNIRTG